MRVIWITLGLALGPAVAMGLGRFAYSILLPAMRTDLGWSYAQAGWMNTANAGGYLAGALMAPLLVGRFGAARAFRGGLALLVPVLAAPVWFHGDAALLLWRALAGMAGGVVYVAGGLLAIGLAGEGMAGVRVVGLFYSGSGIGLVVAGAVLPPLLAARGDGGWLAGWLVVGLLALPCAALAAVAALRAERPMAARPLPLRLGPALARSPWMIAGYLLFGMGSIGYMTFIYAAITAGGGWTRGMTFWVLLGSASVAAPWVWSGLLGRMRSGRAFMLVLSVAGTGTILPWMSDGLPAIILSALCFGGSFFMSVSVTSLHIKRAYSSETGVAAVSAFTLAFGIGQLLGPPLNGTLADHGVSLAASLLVSTALIVLGALIGGAQRDPWTK